MSRRHSRRTAPVSAERLRDVLRSAFWLVPAACTVLAIALGVGLLALDDQIPYARTAFLFPGPPSGARSFLSAIITSMISVTGLVFSITIVVLQLTSSQFSPRVLRMFLRDRAIQLTLGIFVGTFVYAMVVHRGVLGTIGHDPFVPRIAVTVAFLLVLASIGLFIRYISHIANMIRVATIITAITAETRILIERQCPPGHTPRTPPPLSGADTGPISAPEAGVLVSVNRAALVHLACDNDCVIALIPRIGDFVPAGAALLTVRPNGSKTPAPDRLAAELIRSIALDTERTMEQDIAFGFRQLIDIAQRALSPAINDMTTASQTLDALHDLLRRLATRQLPNGWHFDDGGTPRVLVPAYRFSDYLQITVAEIWRYGADSAQIPGRISAMLNDLASAALPEHQEPIAAWKSRVQNKDEPFQ